MNPQSSVPGAGAPGPDLGVPPFDLLDRRQAERVRAATDVVLFRAHQRAIEANAASPSV
jgi:hypothetical protein